MASLRSLAISILRLDGHTNIAAANRHHARDPSGRSSHFKPHEYDFAGSLPTRQDRANRRAPSPRQEKNAYLVRQLRESGPVTVSLQHPGPRL
jgi:hypothetical protein